MRAQADEGPARPPPGGWPVARRPSPHGIRRVGVLANRPARHYTLVFSEVDGESLTGSESPRGEPGRRTGRAGHDPGTTLHGATTRDEGQPESEQAAHPRSEARAISS
jgi:hypothetical protein